MATAATRARANAAAGAAHEIKLIHIGRGALGLDDATYRAMLANVTGGKTSSKALTPAERQKVLEHMKARGFTPKPKAGSTAAAEVAWQHAPQMRKLRAMWYLLADGGHVDRPARSAACNAALQAWAVRQLGSQHFSHLRFATGDQMNNLVEAMKKWCLRLKLPLA